MTKPTSQMPCEGNSPPKDKYDEESTENPSVQVRGNQLEPGRLLIKFVGASSIRRKDQTQGQTKLNMFLSITLGSNSGRPLQNSTEATGNATTGSISLAGDLIKFDVHLNST